MKCKWILKSEYKGTAYLACLGRILIFKCQNSISSVIQYPFGVPLKNAVKSQSHKIKTIYLAGTVMRFTVQNSLKRDRNRQMDMNKTEANATKTKLEAIASK